MTKQQLSKIRAIAGRKGGLQTKKLYGREHFKKSGKKGLEKRWQTA